MGEIKTADYSKQDFYEIPLNQISFGVNWLILSDNKISLVPEQIKTLRCLTRLALNDNRIERISSGIGKLQQLTWIDLTRNKLQNLPDEVGDLKMVAGLGLSENDFREIPNCIYRLHNLRKFGFFSNKVRYVHPDIRLLKNLVKIDLSNNQVVQLPDEFCELVNLNWLNLSNNKLTRLPENLNKLKNLEELGLGTNKLTELPNISDLQKLRILPIFKNKLTRVHSSISKLQHIEKLDFSDNCIKEFPMHVIHLPRLKYLNLKSNRINKIDSKVFDGRISSITMIDVSENKLECIPLSFFKTFTNITTIRLNDNPFSYSEIKLPVFPSLLEVCYNLCLHTGKRTKPWIRCRFKTRHRCDSCGFPFVTEPHIGYSISSVSDGTPFVVEKLLCSIQCYGEEMK